MNSNWNISGNICALNESAFNIVRTKSDLMNSTTYYKCDLDLRQYTTYNTPFSFISIRKFIFMCCLASGAQDVYLFSWYKLPLNMTTK